MELITNHIDEILEHFPVNKVTLQMRNDLLEATKTDYDTLLENGKTNQETSEIIIANIATPEKFASMIPNKYTTSYFIYWLIAIVATILVFSYISNPDFLQIFLPTRMEFPDIIEKFILYIFATTYTYALCFSFYRLLPQKVLNRSTVQSAALLYAGTVMCALYFSIAMAFVWYTFNGFNPVSITFDILSKFIYTFYKLFFSSNIVVVLYSVINGILFVFSNSAYHLDKKPQPYQLSELYKVQEKEDLQPSQEISLDQTN